MKGKLLVGFLAAGLCVSGAGLTDRVEAQEDESVSCRFSVDVSFEPGLGLAGTGRVGSNGETGSFDCGNTALAGDTVQGPGTYGIEGTYNGGCPGGTSQGRYFLTFRTPTGRLQLEGPYEFTWGAPGNRYHQDMGSHDFEGELTTGPAEGPLCLLATPSAHLEGAGRLSPKPRE